VALNQTMKNMQGTHAHEAAEIIFELLQCCLQWEQDLGTCLENLEIPTVVTPATGDLKSQQVVFCNSAYKRRFGHGEEDLKGRRLDGLLAPDMRGTPLDDLNEALRQEGHGQSTIEVVGKDGSRQRVERLAVRAPSWEGLNVAGDVYLFFDRPLGTLTPIASDVEVSESQRIALQVETLLRMYIHRNYRQGMHPAQWSALRYFRLAPPEARTLTGFAKAHRTTMGTASTTVSTLVGKGYLKKQGFRGSVEVTDAGQALLQEDPLNYVVTSLRDMSEEQRRWAQYTLTALCEAFQGDED